MKKFRLVATFSGMLFFVVAMPIGALEIQITTSPANQYYSAISGDKIVWEDYRTGNSKQSLCFLVSVYTHSLRRSWSQLKGSLH